ncbi:hypothetical protein A3Q56_04900 [Intoshia linei]|uniref:Uncharacterized protein n=1 Tax=Intoshia linei TaxID=1819745 RepID=A0A177AZ82_9BILA|nr:hypothetical protein A3Q56_04900 [Intoshia linei]
MLISQHLEEHRSIVLQNNPLPTISNVFIEEKGALRIKLMAIARFLVIDEENYKHKMYLLDRLDFVTVLVNTGRDTCLDFVREEAIRLLVVLSTKRDHSNFSIIKDVLIELKKRCKREDIPDFETCQ